MLIKINDTEIAAYPDTFLVTTMDLDNGETTTRTADGTLRRDRVAVKRKIEMTFGMLTWDEANKLLQSVKGLFFTVYYPDPQEGGYVTKTFYCGDRPAAVAAQVVTREGNNLVWKGIKLSLIER